MEIDKSLNFRVIYASSELSRECSKDLATPRTNSKDDRITGVDIDPHMMLHRGWTSARNCKYPQEIGIELYRPSLLHQIKVFSHKTLVSNSVHVFTSESVNDSAAASLDNLSQYFSASFNPIGKMNLENQQSQLALNSRTKFLKLLISRPKDWNKSWNKNNQVSIRSIQLFGEPVTMYSNNNNEIASTIEYDSDDNLESALLSAGIPLELIADTCSMATCDKVSAKALSKLHDLKLAAVKNDEFDEATRLKKEIETLTPIAEKILVAEQDERAAVILEDFTVASRASHALSELYRTRDLIIAAAFAINQSTVKASESWKDYIFSTDNVVATTKSLNNEPSDKSYSASDMEYALKKDGDDLSSNGVLDEVMKDWLEEQKLKAGDSSSSSSSILPSDISNIQKTHHSKLVECFGMYFTRCILSKSWKMRQASVRVAEQYSYCIMQSCESADSNLIEIHEAYYELATIGLSDPVPTVLFSTLHLIKTIFETPESYNEGDQETFGVHLIPTVVISKGFSRITTPFLHHVMSKNVRIRTRALETFHFLLFQDLMWKVMISSLCRQNEEIPWRLLMAKLVLCQYITANTEIMIKLSDDSLMCKNSALGKLGYFVGKAATHSDERVVEISVKCIHQLIDFIGTARTTSLWPNTLLAKIHKKIERSSTKTSDIAAKTPVIDTMDHAALFRQYPLDEDEINRVVNCMKEVRELKRRDREGNLLANTKSYLVPIKKVEFNVDKLTSHESDRLHGIGTIMDIQEGGTHFIGSFSPRHDSGYEKGGPSGAAAKDEEECYRHAEPLVQVFNPKKKAKAAVLPDEPALNLPTVNKSSLNDAIDCESEGGIEDLSDSSDDDDDIEEKDSREKLTQHQSVMEQEHTNVKDIPLFESFNQIEESQAEEINLTQEEKAFIPPVQVKPVETPRSHQAAQETLKVQSPRTESPPEAQEESPPTPEVTVAPPVPEKKRGGCVVQ